MGKKILSNISFVPSSSGILIWFQQKPEIWNNFLSKKIWIVYLNWSLKWILSFFVDGAQPILHRTVEDETPEKIFFVRLNYLFCSSVLCCPHKSKKNERIKLEKKCQVDSRDMWVERVTFHFPYSHIGTNPDGKNDP